MGRKLNEREWHLVWEEALDAEARGRVTRAVREGEPLDDRDEAAVAIELARRKRRAIRWGVGLNLIVYVAVLGVLGLLYEPGRSGSYWLAVALLLAACVFVPLVGWWRSQRIGRAERANRTVFRARET